MTTFSAEVIEVKSRKSASGDKIISLKLETNEEQALELQKYIAEAVVRVNVEGSQDD